MATLTDLRVYDRSAKKRAEPSEGGGREGVLYKTLAGSFHLSRMQLLAPCTKAMSARARIACRRRRRVMIAF